MNREHEGEQPNEAETAREPGREVDPVELLRAADPAAGVEPSTGFAEEVVARATAPAAEAEAAAEPAAAAPVADLAAERTRRRTRWLPLAAAAASVAIVGAAGFWAGSATGSTNLASSAAPPISLQGVNGADGRAMDSSAGAPETAVGLDQKMMAGSDAMIAPYGWGRNVFSASGLSDEPGTGAGYAYDSGAAGAEERVAALAAAFGIAGKVELRDGTWSVGPQDGTAPTLSVGLDGTLGFWFNDPLANPWNCGVMPMDDTAGDGAEDIAPVDPCVPNGTAPGEAAALDELRAVIAAAGADPAAFEYSSETWEGSPTRYAQAWPVVDGQRLDQSWSLELAESGVVSASGQLARIIAIGDYPIVSEQEGFERLSDPRFGAQMTAMPFVREGDAVVEEWVPPTAPPATPGTGASVSWSVNEVEIVSARLGLTSQWQPDGTVLVVPAYEFTDTDGGTWSVIAVADASLDFSAE